MSISLFRRWIPTFGCPSPGYTGGRGRATCPSTPPRPWCISPNPLCPRSRQPRPSAAIRSPTPSRPTPAMTSTPPKRRATPPRRTTGAPPTSTPCRSGRPTVFTPTRRPASMPDAITIPAPSAASASTMRTMSLPITRIRRSSSRQRSWPTRITASIPRRRPTSA